MNGSDYHGRPAVLRCGRCGRIADWKEARVQIVCGCRAYLELPPPLVREAVPADRERALGVVAPGPHASWPDAHLARLRALPAHGNRTLRVDRLFLGLLCAFFDPLARS